MNLKPYFRTIVFLVLVGLLVVGLSSCKLPASSGPQPAGTGEGFPIPGTAQTSGGIDVSKLATQTAQAAPPVTAETSVPTEPTSVSQPTPVATKKPSSPTATSVPAFTATSVIYVTATAGSPPETYTLEEGEYPFCIARRFDVNQNELLELNGLTPESLYHAGDVLKIPQTGDPFDGTRMLRDHPTTYTVLEGQTLNTIACLFGDVSPDMIALQNHLDSNTVEPGTELVIP